MREKGLFITFEGADGCGKTTQQKLAAKYLEEKGFEVVLTREPGATDLGKQLREILLHYDGEVSDRAQHIDMLVNPAVEDGKIVLCDRHIDSTVAYQGYGRGINIERLKLLNNIATNGKKPDLTIVFDVDVKTSQSRVGDSKDRMESAGAEFHNKVRYGYLELAKEEPQRIKVVDATKSIEEVFKDVVNILNSII